MVKHDPRPVRLLLIGHSLKCSSTSGSCNSERAEGKESVKVQCQSVSYPEVFCRLQGEVVLNNRQKTDGCTKEQGLFLDSRWLLQAAFSGVFQDPWSRLVHLTEWEDKTCEASVQKCLKWNISADVRGKQQVHLPGKGSPEHLVLSCSSDSECWLGVSQGLVCMSEKLPLTFSTFSSQTH